MRIAALLLVVLLSGACSHATIALGNGATAAASSTVVAGSAGGAVVASGGAAVALVLALGVADYAANPAPFPDPRSLFPSSTQPVPPMAPGRLVSEQDCSKPVDLTRGNLRCK